MIDLIVTSCNYRVHQEYITVSTISFSFCRVKYPGLLKKPLIFRTKLGSHGPKYFIDKLFKLVRLSGFTWLMITQTLSPAEALGLTVAAPPPAFVVCAFVCNVSRHTLNVKKNNRFIY